MPKALSTRIPPLSKVMPSMVIVAGVSGIELGAVLARADVVLENGAPLPR